MTLGVAVIALDDFFLRKSIQDEVSGADAAGCVSIATEPAERELRNAITDTFVIDRHARARRVGVEYRPAIHAATCEPLPNVSRLQRRVPSEARCSSAAAVVGRRREPASALRDSNQASIL